MEAIKRLLHAVSENDLASVQVMATGGTVLQCRDEHGHSPVSTAAREGHLVMMRWLLENGASANSLGCNDHPAIVLATLAGHVDLVAVLLQHHADPNRSRASGGETALHAAAISRHVELVHLLVEAGAQINIHTAKHVESDFLWNVLLTSDTPLHLAACYGPETMVECLLSLGANPRLENYRQETPLACALRMRRPAAVLAPLRGERYSAWSETLPVRKAIVA